MGRPLPEQREECMHPIIRLAALSWIVVLSLIAIAIKIAVVAFGGLPYCEASPDIAIAILCLAVAIEASLRVLARQ